MKHVVFLLLVFPALCFAQAVAVQQYHPHDFELKAQVTGNPFEVTLSGEFRGPNGARLVVPGFYDGEGRWKIRFSAPRPGRWQLRTASPLPALAGKQWAIEASANTDSSVHGGLRVDARNPYHFVWEDGTRYFLLGYEADWIWALDLGQPSLDKTARFVDSLDRAGFNHVIMNVYAHDTTWSKGRQNEWDYGPPAMYAWEGTNEQPDHSRFNAKFFQHYDRVVALLHSRGIVAHLFLKVYNKLVNWPKPGSPEEAQYFRYVVARYQAYGNVVWDFSKEGYYEKDKPLEKRLLETVRATDAYHRLTTVHDDDSFEWDPAMNAVLDFRTDQQHDRWAEMTAFDRAFRARPVFNSEFGYERGVEDLPTYRVMQDWQEVLRRAWLIYMAGGYGAYYYSNTAWDLVKFEPEPPGYARFRLLKETLSALPYWEMQPANELAVGGPCLAHVAPPSRRSAQPPKDGPYTCYVEGANIRLNLIAAGRLTAAEWVDTWTGARRPAQVSPSRVQSFAKPKDFAGPALLIVK